MLLFMGKQRKKEGKKREEIYTCISANAWIFTGRISKKLGTVSGFASREGNRIIEKKERDTFLLHSVLYLCIMCM